MGFPAIDGITYMSGSGEFNLQSSNSGFDNPPKIADAVSCPKCGMTVPRSARNCPNDGADLLLRKGQVFADKYELLDCVGSGGMGVIYKARHLILDKVVAIKVLHNNTADSNLIMRFQREAKAASSLNHINVITVYDFGVFEGTAPYMVMDYLQGRTLQDYIDERDDMSLRDTLDIIEQILSALVHASKKNILHRDLKPGNIMVLHEEGEPRVIKLLDFGLAKLLDRDDQVTLSAVGAAMGSPAYMSPEQATGLQVDARSDLYSLGCLMYEMLTGVPPLMGETSVETLVNRLNRKVPPISDFLTDSKRSRAYNPAREVPTIVEMFVAKLLERDARDRFQSAQEARNYLNTIWEYVDVPDMYSDSSTQRAARAARANSKKSGRATVKDLRPLDNGSTTSSSSNEIGSIGSFSGEIPALSSLSAHQRNALGRISSTELAKIDVDDQSRRVARRSHQDLRKIQTDTMDPIPSPETVDEFRFDVEHMTQKYEYYSHRLFEITQQFQRSNPGLYRVAVILAVTALLVVILIGVL
jgi:serine/threonine protein kinase